MPCQAGARFAREICVPLSDLASRGSGKRRDDADGLGLDRFDVMEESREWTVVKVRYLPNLERGPEDRY